jgi:tetratricopeptide (TPR) repeat protein
MAALSLAAVLVGSAPRADAGCVPVLARQLSDRGRTLHELGDYEQAIAAFSRAYELAPTPALLFNLAQSYRLAGNCPRAALLYRRYLATDPESDARAVAERHLAVVDACAKHARAPALGRALVAVDAPVAAGPLTVDRGRGERRVGLITVGGGGVLLAVAAYYAHEASAASDQVTNGYAHGGVGKQLAVIERQGRDASDRATGLAVTGGIVIAAGAILYLVGRHERRVTITPRAGGGDVALGWTF